MSSWKQFAISSCTPAFFTDFMSACIPSMISCSNSSLAYSHLWIDQFQSLTQIRQFLWPQTLQFNDFSDVSSVLEFPWFSCSVGSGVVSLVQYSYHWRRCTVLLLVPLITFCNSTAWRGNLLTARTLWTLPIWLTFGFALSALSASFRQIFQFSYTAGVSALFGTIIWRSTAVRTALCWASLRWQNSSRPDWQAVCPKW